MNAVSGFDNRQIRNSTVFDLKTVDNFYNGYMSIM